MADNSKSEFYEIRFARTTMTISYGYGEKFVKRDGVRAFYEHDFDDVQLT